MADALATPGPRKFDTPQECDTPNKGMHPNHYVRDTPLQQRRACAARVSAAYPTRVPVVVQSGDDDMALTHARFLVPRGVTLGSFLAEVRKHTKYAGTQLHPSKALFLLVGDEQAMGALAAPMGSVHERAASEDGLLYVWVVTESTFG